MDNITAIPSNRKLPLAMDYELLRKEGRQYIEDLAHDLWTDYNTHDPGITILEALCYAITELAYRSGFEMKDLLTNEKGGLVKGQTFYTANEILTINPVTINDYRKLLVDIPGIQNAWLVPFNYEQTIAGEQNIYADCAGDKLTYDKTSTSILLNGLYRVLLSLEYDDQYGDLNNGDIIIENPAVAGRFNEGAFFFSIELPSWKAADFRLVNLAKDANNIDTITVSPDADKWKAVIKFLNETDTICFGITISKKPADGKAEDADINQVFSGKEYVSRIFSEYYNKISLAYAIVHRAVKKLQECRNLCEDFAEVTTIDDDEIAFCLDVDVQPNADIEKIQAEIFFAIENYLNPPVKFYTLRELLKKKVPVDEIFSGPVLEHGFVDTAQLELTRLRTVIHASDIINLIMDLDGVIAVRNFLMTKYDADGNIVPGFKGEQWCMPILPLHKPVLRTDKSKLILFKNQLPFRANYQEVKDTISLLHALQSANRLSSIREDLTVPMGIHRDTVSHWPLQYDLPQVYGVSEAGLPANAPVERIAQQKQLKAYLLFYDQLLGDFVCQLSNAYQLYSIEDIKHTYFAAFLSQVKDTEDLYVTSGSKKVIEKAISNPDSTAVLNDWQKLYESKPVYEDRRNRFLDHLLSRFAESFNDYAMMMFDIRYSTEWTETKKEFQHLANAKINTLKDYPLISSRRGTGFNYLPLTPVQGGGLLNEFTLDDAQLWDTRNVSGLERRIASIAGMADYRRRFLHCIKQGDITCTQIQEGTVSGEPVIKCNHSFAFTNLEGDTLSSVQYEKKQEAETAREKVLTLADKADNYSVEDINGEFVVHFLDILKSTAAYESEEKAKAVIENFVNEFAAGCGDPEGLHVVEHILLRPHSITASFLNVCLDGCDCPCEIDPYSFCASVVLPAMPGRFNNMAFRQYVENRIREEAPAHVMLKICWLGYEQMREFEVKYKAWIKALAFYNCNKPAGISEFIDASNQLLAILNNMHCEYPEANLHDCEESKEGSNTVVLNKTVLGTF